MEKQIAREHFTLLVSKSDFLVSISLLLVSKSDFLAADQLSLRSPAAPVAGSFLYMPPRENSFHRSAITPRRFNAGWSHRPRRPSLFLLREPDWPAKAFSRIGITPSVVINQPDLELA